MKVKFKIPWIKLLLIQFCIFILGFLYGIIAGKNNLINEFNPINLDALKIMKNNFMVIILILTSGLLTFGTLSTIIIFINGIIVGETIIAVYQKSGVSPLFTGLLPHLIPELSAILLSASITLLPAYFLLKTKTIKLKSFYIETCILLMSIVLLLIFAGLVEGNFSYFY
ncbi:MULTISPECIES: stage II sporulation protein M [Bacillus cereus group]|uniref:Integral membrane protein n=1 Tax=Bacillus cereus TIAC219 TaxID=718222 RepID=A0ABC9SSJ4_BACCE|nr:MULTISPECIES: stage II sporulation protein M [Bacillus cereus group]EJP83329.1 hypothetical protein IC1_05569 [Bacillus cereus VD022]EOQ58876.1 hypothetical protein IAY_05626 [Bacillus cereus TIAC219]MBJ8024895.1 stage II sporulation protein M [Bacillus cereus]MBJ8037369.1 stage II sporulation protein M [Bacillus cereus]MCU4813168.1 stage II sporulation protein M [Bacillus cereus]